MNKKVYCYVFKENERFYGGWTRWEGDEAVCRIGSTHRWRLDTGSGDGERRILEIWLQGELILASRSLPLAEKVEEGHTNAWNDSWQQTGEHFLSLTAEGYLADNVVQNLVGWGKREETPMSVEWREQGERWMKRLSSWLNLLQAKILPNFCNNTFQICDLLRGS